VIFLQGTGVGKST